MNFQYLLAISCVVLLFCFCNVHPTPNALKNTLVLLDNWGIRESHSLFFKSLKERGHSLTYKISDDGGLIISEFGEYLYQNIILFSPSTREFGGKINVETLLEFVDNGGNVLVAANDQIGEAVQKFATECGVEFDDEGTALFDHFEHHSMDDGQHKLIIGNYKNVLPIEVMTNKVDAPLLYRGIGMSNDKENPLLISVLNASQFAYSYKADKSNINDAPLVVGSSARLLSAMQTRNNARVVFCGSLDFFSDELFTSPVTNARTGKTHPVSGNTALSDSITRWNFQEAGVLRFRNVTYKKIATGAISSDGQPEDASYYTIMDQMEYSIVIEELVDADPKGVGHKWVPYVASDVQMEFVRIDPFVRLNMKHVSDGRYVLRFKIPDVYGVFKFVVDYNKAGYSRVFSSTQVSVRPLRHTQYERFIQAAYPYYTSAFSMMLGVFLFSLIYLHFIPSADKSKSE